MKEEPGKNTFLLPLNVVAFLGLLVFFRELKSIISTTASTTTEKRIFVLFSS